MELVDISNPKTPEGGWENEKDGCAFCGAISSAYAGISVQLDKDSHLIRICGGCLNELQNGIGRMILSQCAKRSD